MAKAKCKKRKYRDAISAGLALASSRSGRKGCRLERRAYRCPDCRAWHLTSN